MSLKGVLGLGLAAALIRGVVLAQDSFLGAGSRSQLAEIRRSFDSRPAQVLSAASRPRGLSESEQKAIEARLSALFKPGDPPSARRSFLGRTPEGRECEVEVIRESTDDHIRGMLSEGKTPQYPPGRFEYRVYMHRYGELSINDLIYSGFGVYPPRLDLSPEDVARYRHIFTEVEISPDAIRTRQAGNPLVGGKSIELHFAPGGGLRRYVYSQRWLLRQSTYDCALDGRTYP